LARRALEEHLPLARNHELRLFANGQPVPIATGSSNSTAPLKIEGDEERLEQVLSNLISNAIKYSPQDGPVTVSLQFTKDGYVEIAVEDRGIGVSPEDQARLTERFFRAENAQFIDSKGLGLGLYLVNALVIKHGGSLSIKSEGIPGKGSTFIIKLPYRR
jgi:two-component system sensor histidine kinase SenX3